MFDYSSLAALAAIIREGSFDRAARSLNVTASAVSQRIRLLEERVGCVLVIRGQPCTATARGRQLCQHFDRVRLLETELQDALPGLSPQGESRVALPIAVNADSLATWFTPAIARYAATSPVLVELAVDDESHTGELLRTGEVLAAVTASARPAAGCSSQTLGSMRYRAAASPEFMQHYFAGGVNYRNLSQAPSLGFDNKDTLQDRWAHRFCRRHLELPRHALPSPEAFVTAALAGMGWGLHPESLIAHLLEAGSLVELECSSPLDIPLYWQQARLASSLLDGLTREILAVTSSILIQHPD